MAATQIVGRHPVRVAIGATGRTPCTRTSTGRQAREQVARCSRAAKGVVGGSAEQAGHEGAKPRRADGHPHRRGRSRRFRLLLSRCVASWLRDETALPNHGAVAGLAAGARTTPSALAQIRWQDLMHRDGTGFRPTAGPVPSRASCLAGEATNLQACFETLLRLARRVIAATATSGHSGPHQSAATRRRQEPMRREDVHAARSAASVAAACGLFLAPRAKRSRSMRHEAWRSSVGDLDVLRSAAPPGGMRRRGQPLSRPGLPGRRVGLHAKNDRDAVRDARRRLRRTRRAAYDDGRERQDPMHRENGPPSRATPPQAARRAVTGHFAAFLVRGTPRGLPVVRNSSKNPMHQKTQPSVAAVFPRRVAAAGSPGASRRP